MKMTDKDSLGKRPLSGVRPSTSTPGGGRDSGLARRSSLTRRDTAKNSATAEKKKPDTESELGSDAEPPVLVLYDSSDSTETEMCFRKTNEELMREWREGIAKARKEKELKKEKEKGKEQEKEKDKEKAEGKEQNPFTPKGRVRHSPRKCYVKLSPIERQVTLQRDCFRREMEREEKENEKLKEELERTRKEMERIERESRKTGWSDTEPENEERALVSREGIEDQIRMLKEELEKQTKSRMDIEKDRDEERMEKERLEIEIKKIEKERENEKKERERLERESKSTGWSEREDSLIKEKEKISEVKKEMKREREEMKKEMEKIRREREEINKEREEIKKEREEIQKEREKWDQRIESLEREVEGLRRSGGKITEKKVEDEYRTGVKRKERTPVEGNEIKKGKAKQRCESERDSTRGEQSSEEMEGEETERKSTEREINSEKEKEWEINRRRKRKEWRERTKYRKQSENGRQKEMEGENRDIGSKKIGKISEAIRIKVQKDRSYADVCKEILTKNKERLNNVKRIRKSRTGDIIIELEDEGRAIILREQITETGNSCTALCEMIDVELINLDPTVDPDIVRRDFQEHYKNISDKDIRIKIIRECRDGTKTAVLQIPARYSKEIINNSYIKIGYVKTRAQIAPKIRRCFRCQELGHLSYECRNISNRDVVCRKCGKNGHVQRECEGLINCIACERRKVSIDRRKHIAGTYSCPVYRDYFNRKREKLEKILRQI